MRFRYIRESRISNTKENKVTAAITPDQIEKAVTLSPINERLVSSWYSAENQKSMCMGAIKPDS